MASSSEFFGVLVAVGCLVGPVAAQPKPVVTLAEAIERSEGVQPRVIQAAGVVRNADARVRASKGAFLPNLNVTTSAGESYSDKERVDPNTSQLASALNPSFNGTVNTQIELFDGFRRAAESRSARANRESAAQGLDDARFQQGLQTTNQFFDVLAATQLVRVREASVRRADEQLKVSIARLRAGAAIRSDSLRSLVTLGNARVQLINAGTQLATAEANLGRLIGLDGPAGAVDDSGFYRVTELLDTTALRAEALSRAPQIRTAEAAARAARASIAVARAGYWPTLTLGAGNSLIGANETDKLSKVTAFKFYQTRQASLTVNWAVFNRFTREQNIANQTSTAETSEATAAEARRQVLANLTTRLAELEAAQVRTGITQTSLAAASEDIRVQQERYRLGVATIVDVLTSQESLTQAGVDAVTARFDYLRAKAQIQALIGRQL